MVFSNSPSIWGRKVVLKCKVIPRDFYSFGQTWYVNRGSRSDRIDISTSWSLTISLMYSLANLSKEKILRMARKCADLVSRSTITQMASWPICVWGKPTMKSMVMCSHFHFEIGKGWRVSRGFWCHAPTRRPNTWQLSCVLKWVSISQNTS